MNNNVTRRTFLKGSVATAVIAAVSGCASQVKGKQDTYLTGLIARMTLEEKAGQLHMDGVLSPRMVQPNFQKINPFTPNFSPEQAADLLKNQQAQIKSGMMGMMTSPEDIDSVIYAQTAAVKDTRLKIPLIFGADIIHGHHTIFPVPLAEAASFEPELAERTARACAVEATTNLGIDVTYAPMVDIARDQRWGRVVEGAGEDVLLGSLFAAARVKGFQGNGPADSRGLLACPKHFLAYGAAESGLDYQGTSVSDRVLHEVYLPPFKAAFEAGAIFTMASFNTIDGVPATGNKAILSDLLRDEMHFSGVVISDFQSELELIKHGYAKDEKAAAKLALSAGCDIGMVSGIFPKYVPELVRSGELDEAIVDKAVYRILFVKQQAGLFDDPFHRIAEIAAPQQAPAEHIALAREAATKSVVLLKNTGSVLPLSKKQKVALIGPFAKDLKNIDGSWSPFAPQKASVSLEAGFAEKIPAAQLLTEDGCGIDTAIEGGIKRAVEAAKQCDVVVLAIGEATNMSGEASSRAEITLPAAQQALAEALAATGKPLVVLLRNGRAMALEGAVREASAILVTWFLGTESGHAIADVVFGDQSPSGRLPVTFPIASGQQPYYYARESSGRPPAPGTTHMFQSHFIGIPDDALYPFGHGLTYSEITYSGVTLDKSEVKKGEAVTASVTVTNTGKRAATEVVQCYIQDRFASVVQPVQKLIDFNKITLAAGESRSISFTIKPQQMTFIARDLSQQLESGEFRVWIAPSARTGEAVSFILS